MSGHRIVVLDADTLGKDADWAPLRAIGPCTLHGTTAEADLPDRLRGVSVALTNKVPFTAATLSRLPDLRYIGVLATGVNVIDLPAARSHGVAVTNVPDYSSDSVAQLTFGLLLELCHRVGHFHHRVLAGEWERSSTFCFGVEGLRELSGKTMGLIGYGAIARKVATLATAFGMKVLVSSRSAQPGVAMCALDTLLAASDVVSLHCPLTPETHHLINTSRLQGMKRGALLLNTGRGDLVDEAALFDALSAGHLGGYGADVLCREPPRQRPALFDAPRTVFTPHIAWGTLEARTRLLHAAAENLNAFLAGHLLHRVS